VTINSASPTRRGASCLSRKRGAPDEEDRPKTGRRADGTTIASGSDDKTVRVWDAVSGERREVIQGTSDREADVEAIAAGPSRFRFRALRRGLETVIEDAATATPVARFPVPLDHIPTFPNGRAWVGASANHLYIIGLEDSSKVKGESGRPEGGYR
jgi:hypothetical protein